MLPTLQLNWLAPQLGKWKHFDLDQSKIQRTGVNQRLEGLAMRRSSGRGQRLGIPRRHRAILIEQLVALVDLVDLLRVRRMVVLGPGQRAQLSVHDDATRSASFLLYLTRVIVAPPVDLVSARAMAIVQVVVQHQAGRRPRTFDELQGL